MVYCNLNNLIPNWIQNSWPLLVEQALPNKFLHMVTEHVESWEEKVKHLSLHPALWISLAVDRDWGDTWRCCYVSVWLERSEVSFSGYLFGGLYKLKDRFAVSNWQWTGSEFVSGSLYIMRMDQYSWKGTWWNLVWIDTGRSEITITHIIWCHSIHFESILTNSPV